ncbi:hypothetical protein QJS66_19830 [Kocuria rhizophila]|nr:hypothetical protein QJS66_19830 [Kocuria rhizophila]
MTAIAWVVLLAVLMMGVQNGIGKLNVVPPLLVVMFLIMVVMAVTLPGRLRRAQRAVHLNWEAWATPPCGGRLR